MTTATAPGRLSESDIEFFQREGYLVVPDAIDPAEMQPAIDEISDAIDTVAKDLVAKGELSSDFAEYGFEHRLARISAETDKAALAIWNGVLHGPGIFSLITHPSLLDLAASLCGPELVASSVYRLRPKIPNYSYGAVPWHQDSGYFEPFCDEHLVVTMWMPLVDATPENGCLWVLPRQHTKPLLPHKGAEGKAYLQINEDDLPERGKDAVCCQVPKGGVLLMTNRTPHVSYENKTDIVRWSMDLRYQSASLPTNAPMTRLEGEIEPRGESGAPDFVPTACYPPEADFLVRSNARPDEVIRTPEQFAELREKHVAIPATDRWGEAWWHGEANRTLDD